MRRARFPISTNFRKAFTFTWAFFILCIHVMGIPNVFGSQLCGATVNLEVKYTRHGICNTKCCMRIWALKWMVCMPSTKTSDYRLSVNIQKLTILTLSFAYRLHSDLVTMYMFDARTSVAVGACASRHCIMKFGKESKPFNLCSHQKLIIKNYRYPKTSDFKSTLPRRPCKI